MLSVKWRKCIYFVLSLVLLLSMVVPFGYHSEAAQMGNTSRTVKIAAGGYHSLALKSDGTVVAWGENAFGQTDVPSGLNDVVAIAGGTFHSLALKSDGTVVAWGDNRGRQSTVPTGLNGVVAIAGGGYHSLALKSDGTVVAWGYSGYGQTTVPTGLSSIVSIAAGGSHSLALKSDGTVVAWGNDGYGQTTVPGYDNKLTGLSLQEGPFDKDFSPLITSYNSYIGPSVSSVHITATMADTTSSSLYVNDQLVESGNTEAVTILGDSMVIPIHVEPYLNPGKTTYTITVLRDTTSPDIHLETNGNTSAANTAASKVTVTDTESGIDAASLQYAWAQSISVPSIGWKDFESGDTLTQTNGDGSWYLHIRATDQVGNIAEVVSNAFILDNTRPTVDLSSTASGTVNAAFPITITFNETVTGFTEDGIIVTNATLSDFFAVDAKTYTATIRPNASGQTVTVQVVEDKAIDVVGHGNEASNVWSIMYDTTKPVVIFGFTDHQIFNAPPTSIVLSVSEAVYGVDSGLEIGDTDIKGFLSIEMDGQPFTDYTASYDNASHIIMLTFDSKLGDGTYNVMVAGDMVQNANQNTLDAASAKFTVAVPIVTCINANPTSFSNIGGSTTVTITGANLMGQSLMVYVNGAYAATAIVRNDSSAEAIVTLPQNPTFNTKNYSLTVYLNGVEVTSNPTYVAVAGANPPSPNDGETSTEPITPSQPVIPTIPLYEIHPEKGGTVIAQGVEITFPVGVFGGTFRVNVEKIPSVKEEWRTKDKNILSEIYEFTKNHEGNFDKPVTITLPFDAENMDQNQYAVAIYWLNEETGEWIQLDNIKVDWNSGKVSGDTNHFTKFAVLATEKPIERPTVKLSDISGHWAENDIVKLTELGAVSGYQDGSFKPNNSITRAEFISIVVRALGLEQKGKKVFSDTQSHWAKDVIATAYEHGIIQGYNETTFGVNDLITREQMAVIIVKALDIKSGDGINFIDHENISSWAVDAIQKATSKRIISGYPNGSFQPKNFATRAEAIKVIVNAMEAVIVERLLQKSNLI